MEAYLLKATSLFNGDKENLNRVHALIQDDESVDLKGK